MIQIVYILAVMFFVVQTLPAEDSTRGKIRFMALALLAGVVGLPFDLIAVWMAMDAPQNLFKVTLALGQLTAHATCFYLLMRDRALRA